MTIHIVKLCVGVASVEELEAHRDREMAARRAAGEPEVAMHVTRMFPARKDDVEAGGSLYWVMSGAIQCRSEIIALEAVTGDDGIKRCAIIMSPQIIRTAAAPRRPFQGWRYLKSEDAPRDISGGGEGGDGLPGELRAKLLELGAW
ncbi:lysophospholipase [Maricaulis sp. W15]|uniref:DUF1489 family protein n=1 Tax=Maricaulis sp. W15 TaxID=1772333 RepID=UPI000948E31C|nr:DUF1489 domain-containing protein [Maricaulis sp. W15]OLF73174.1 lysophospholipase [Maricaulis sp. W15]